MARDDWADLDFYAVLKVSIDCTTEEVNAAFRRAARDAHPDARLGDPAATTRFQELERAHSVLGRADRRQEYDRFRAARQEAIAAQLAREQLRAQQARDAAAWEAQQRARQHPPQAPRPRFPDARPRPVNGVDRTARLRVDFVTAALGHPLTFDLDGERITVRIPAGIETGGKIRVRERGGFGNSPQSRRGDLLLEVIVDPHPVFWREGLDVVLTLPVSFAEAALGARVEIPTLQDENLIIGIPTGAPDGLRLVVAGRGVTAPQGTGRLVVVIDIVTPVNLSASAQRKLRAFDAAAAHNPRAQFWSAVRGHG